MYGSYVARMRRARGLTQARLAEISGIEQANISAIETGRRLPSAATLHRLVHACGFELTATAGAHVIACPPPPSGDLVIDQLLEGRTQDEPPIVGSDTPISSRVRVLTAVLDTSEALIRAR